MDYQSGKLPDPHVSYDSTSTTEQQDIKQFIKNQEKQLDYYWYELNEQKTQNDLLKLHNEKLVQQNDDLAKKIDTLIQQGSTGDSSTQDSNTQILAKLDTIIQKQENLEVGTNTVVTYGVVYIPFFIIVFLCWRFFATFLRTYR